MVGVAVRQKARKFMFWNYVDMAEWVTVRETEDKASYEEELREKLVSYLEGAGEPQEWLGRTSLADLIECAITRGL